MVGVDRSDVHYDRGEMLMDNSASVVVAWHYFAVELSKSKRSSPMNIELESLPEIEP